MNLIFTLLANHILSIIEADIKSNEPAIAQMMENEIKLLMTKLEAFLAVKNPKVEAIAKPILDLVANAAEAAVPIVGEAMVATIPEHQA